MAVKTLVMTCYEINKCGNDVNCIEVGASLKLNSIYVQANSTRTQHGHITTHDDGDGACACLHIDGLFSVQRF